MIVYIQRHGIATHLVEDYDKIVTRKEFIKTTKKWEHAKLTNLGKNQILDKIDLINKDIAYIVYSPLARTRQTAELMNKKKIKMISSDSLIEIISEPPVFLGGLKLKIRSWIMVCVVQSLFNLKIFKYLKEAKMILNTYKRNNYDILIVSHQARIITVLMYCWFSFHWRILKIDTKPAGISIVKYAGEKN